MAFRVLIIDDSLLAVELLKGALASAGIDCDVATQLAELDLALTRAEYDVMLVDVNMPEMYGDDVVEFLRRQRGIKARLLLYSDISESELAAKAKASGADGYIIKSSGLEATVAAIRQRLVTPRARKVLVVESSGALCQMLTGHLGARGYELAWANGGDEATKVILKKKTRPDVVLLDLDTPGLAAKDLCDFLKGNALFGGIPLFVISSASASEVATLAASLGADGALERTADVPTVLLARLER
ncbi:MAG: response regulator [Myxococcaceae bacterium]|nr:response regulator [Myxococcaceae bacterium]